MSDEGHDEESLQSSQDDAAQGAAGSRRYKRSKISAEASAILSKFFEVTPLPDLDARESLAAQLGMTPRSVQVWFQNRRQRTKPTYAPAAQSKAARALVALDPHGAKASSRTSYDPSYESAAPAYEHPGYYNTKGASRPSGGGFEWKQPKLLGPKDSGNSGKSSEQPLADAPPATLPGVPPHYRDAFSAHYRDDLPPHLHRESLPPRYRDGLPLHPREMAPRMDAEWHAYYDRMPPHVRDGLPPHVRETLPPHHHRDSLPPHYREVLPPHHRDSLPPHYRDAPPPHHRDSLPPHYRDAPPPHHRDSLPPHYRDGLPPHYLDALPPPLPPHLRDSLPPHHHRDHHRDIGARSEEWRAYYATLAYYSRADSMRDAMAAHPHHPAAYPGASATDPRESRRDCHRDWREKPAERAFSPQRDETNASPPDEPASMPSPTESSHRQASHRMAHREPPSSLGATDAPVVGETPSTASLLAGATEASKPGAEMGTAQGADALLMLCSCASNESM